MQKDGSAVSFRTKPVLSLKYKFPDLSAVSLERIYVGDGTNRAVR